MKGTRGCCGGTEGDVRTVREFDGRTTIQHTIVITDGQTCYAVQLTNTQPVEVARLKIIIVCGTTNVCLDSRVPVECTPETAFMRHQRKCSAGLGEIHRGTRTTVNHIGDQYDVP